MLLARIVATQVALVALVTARLDRVRQDRERGVVSIEYVVLGAAIIAIIGFLATNSTVQTALSNAFSNLFSKAGKAAG